MSIHPPSKLKILFITKWYPNRYDPQIGVYIRKHASAVSQYCDVAVLHIVSDDQLKDKKFELVQDDRFNLTGVIIYFKKFESSFSFLNKMVNFTRYCRAAFDGLKYIRKNFGDHDITHAYILLRPALIAWYFLLFGNKPFVISEQWSGFATGKYDRKNRIVKWLTKKVMARANAITVVSEFLKNQMLRNGLQGKYNIIPNIVEVPSLKIQPRGDQKIRILAVADLVDEIKNVSGVIRAIAELVPGNPQIEFQLIGDGIDRQKLESLARELNLLNRFVFFLGLKSNEEVYQNLVRCDFLVMNSNFETFSLICAEAIACGKPVVATRCGGPQEFITDETGILVEPGNQQQLIRAIQQMMNTYQSYSPENLKKYAGKKFSSEIASEKFYSIYRSIIHSRLKQT